VNGAYPKGLGPRPSHRPPWADETAGVRSRDMTGSDGKARPRGDANRPRSFPVWLRVWAFGIAQREAGAKEDLPGRCGDHGRIRDRPFPPWWRVFRQTHRMTHLQAVSVQIG